MATPAKPAGEKPIPAARSASENPGEDSAKPKTKKKTLIITGILVGLISSGSAGWYFTHRSPHAEDAEVKLAAPSGPAIFVALEPFTVNLQREAADQLLQVGITLKILDKAIEEHISKGMPEIRSRLIMLLSSKYPSELASRDGKKKLAQEIIAEVDAALGLPGGSVKSATLTDEPAEGTPADNKPNAASGEIASDETASDSETGVEPDAEAEAETSTEETPVAEQKSGIVDVLFTSFIIQ